MELTPCRAFSANQALDGSKPARIRDMFATIVPRYDLVNTLMTLGLDRRWRRATVAMAEPAVFWIYFGRDRLWRVRREGDTFEKSLPSRQAARAFVQVLAARCRSYRLFVEDEDGGFVEESASWPAKLRQLISADDGTSIDQG